MIERRVVRRYVSAIFGAASKAGVVDRVESDLGLISYALESSPALADALKSPRITVQKKKDILKEIFSDKVHEITFAYLCLLVDKRRQEALESTEREYLLLANEARGIITVEVTTAIKLSPELEDALKAKLAKMTGSQVHLTKNVSADIIGGAMIKIGDKVIDGTIKAQLAAVKETLLQ